MANFDIKSLFTNIPLEETPQTTRKFTESWFRQLLTLATKDLIFLFNDKIYSQIDGVGMGNPLGPTFANLFLSHHELN